MGLSPGQTVRRLLSDSPDEALCDSCLSFACRKSLMEMREITEALLVDDPSIQRGTRCASCRRTVATVFFQAAIQKCCHCSQPLSEGEAGVVLEGDRFHDACLRRLMSDDTVRVSQLLNRKSRELIEQSRRRTREGP
jgi:hypothetical protein